MNFWEFKEDHSRGYWHPVSNKPACQHGAALTYGLFRFIGLLLKAAFALLKGVGYVLYLALVGLYKIVEYILRKRQQSLSR